VETDAVLDLMRQTAADVISPRFRSLAGGEVFEKNGPTDLVTVADREAEVVLTAALRAAYPDAMILGEEATEADPGLLAAFAAADHAFTIDPIDGTLNFVQGSPDHAVMIGEMRAGEVVRSWIWQPEHASAWVAERGAGAYRDGTPLPHLAPGDDPAAWRGASSQRVVQDAVGTGFPPVQDTWWSCGVDYPRLAAGDVDHLVYLHTKPWDHVPGSLLVSELGGVVLRADGGPYRPADPGRGLVAGASPAVAERAAAVFGPLVRG
jgi:fructose-1,6-bisphosphatase/inositol monophosphatase family enzyme